MSGVASWLSFRRIVIATLALTVGLSVLVMGSHLFLRSFASGHVYSLQDVDSRPVVMVLGAQVYPDNTPSPYLRARLEIARELYESGKAEAILVSGDNGQDNYNEVDPMRTWLIERGVPDDKVVGDYAGFDTFDSCARARDIFGVSEMIVTTQSFHLDRAVALCRSVGIDTIGVGDDSVRRYRPTWMKSVVREYGAGVKATWEAIAGGQPRYLGVRETSLDEALERS